MPPVESHPLPPFLPDKARILLLGSFPPKRERWSMDFFYPNFNNDMWRIIGLVFFGDKTRFVTEDGRHFDRQKIMDFCTLHGIALYDTAEEVRRLKDNASDKFLEIVRKTDLKAMLKRLPECRAVVATGQKAAEAAAEELGCEVPAVGKFIETGFPAEYLEPESTFTGQSEQGGMDASQDIARQERHDRQNVLQTGNGQKNTSENGLLSGCSLKTRLWRMPSTSRAYPMSIENKAVFYRNLFITENLIPPQQSEVQKGWDGYARQP